MHPWEVLEELPGEWWGRVPDHDGYWVSSYGRVVNPRGKLLAVKVRKDRKRRNHVKIRRRTMLLSRLVARVFVPNDRPRQKTEVHHKDFDAWNDRADNLVWMTGKEHRAIHREHKRGS